MKVFSMKKNLHNPPRYAERILEHIVDENIRYSALGDFAESFHEVYMAKGSIRAHLWYWMLILRSVPSFLTDSLLWSFVMFRNYLKVAIRSMVKHKGYSFINITGLAVGMACCILIFLWVQDELSYDRFHKNSKDIYRLVAYWEKYNWQGFEGSPRPLASAIKEEMPEIMNTARISSHSRKVFRYKDRSFYEDRGIIADPSMFSIFTFPFVKGDPETAFSSPYNFVITESFAYKYFGDENPVGKTMEADGQVWTVSGVIKDIPANSHIRFDYMNSFEFIKELSGWGTSWGSFNFVTYIMLSKNADTAAIAEKVTDIALNNNCPQVKDGVYFRLQPLTNVHLDARKYDRGWMSLGDSKYVYMFSVIAVFILFIACVNFMNLSTARSSLRAREVGMRKTVGASRSQLIRQFFGESILLSVVAFIFAMLLVAIMLPSFNQLADKHLSIGFADFTKLAWFMAVVLLTGIVAGSYPALYLSAFRPVTMLKSTMKSGRKGAAFRRAFVVFQFTIAVVLIIGTIVAYRQLQFIRNIDLGYDRSNVVILPLKENTGRQFETVKSRLLQNPDITSVGIGKYLFDASSFRTTGFDWEGRPPEQDIDMIIAGVDFDFFETLKLQFSAGRQFSEEFPSDAVNAVILNEQAVKEMGIDEPVGKILKTPYGEYSIIGILKNAHLRSLHYEIESRIFFLTDAAESSTYTSMAVKTSGENTKETLSYIETVWNEVNPVSPFEYKFLEDMIENTYGKERRAQAIFNYFSIISIIISCLGLFGLASFMAE